MGKNIHLKTLANLAKKRLLNREYEGSVSKNTCTGKSVSSYFIKNAQALKKLTAQTEFVSITNSEDEFFIKRVVAILKESEIVCNPLGMLADKKHYDSLNDVEKQFYMLNLSEKYNRVKDMYDKEMLGNIKIS